MPMVMKSGTSEPERCSWVLGGGMYGCDVVETHRLIMDSSGKHVVGETAYFTRDQVMSVNKKKAHKRLAKRFPRGRSKHALFSPPSSLIVLDVRHPLNCCCRQSRFVPSSRKRVPLQNCSEEIYIDTYICTYICVQLPARKYIYTTWVPILPRKPMFISMWQIRVLLMWKYENDTTIIPYNI